MPEQGFRVGEENMKYEKEAWQHYRRCYEKQLLNRAWQGTFNSNSIAGFKT